MRWVAMVWLSGCQTVVADEVPPSPDTQISDAFACRWDGEGEVVAAVTLLACEPDVEHSIDCEATQGNDGVYTLDIDIEVDDTCQETIPGCLVARESCGIAGAPETALVDDGTGPVPIADLPDCVIYCGE